MEENISRKSYRLSPVTEIEYMSIFQMERSPCMMRNL